MTGTYQHIGSRFTQVGDQDLGTLNLLSFGDNTIGAPLTQSTFMYDPELPAYDLVNLRAGLRRNNWDVALYLNNVFDERALLSFDRSGARWPDRLPDEPASHLRHLHEVRLLRTSAEDQSRARRSPQPLRCRPRH